MPASDSTAAVKVCATHCPYCSLQCGMNLESEFDGSLTVTKREFSE